MYFQQYPYPFIMPPSPNGEDPITTYQKVHEFLEKLKKENEEKAKTKKKPEPKKYTFFEMWGFAVFAGPVIGLSYLYSIKVALQHIELWFK